MGRKGRTENTPHKINDGLNILNQGINTVKRRGKAQKGENHVLVSGKDVSSKVLCKHPEGQGTVVLPTAECSHSPSFPPGEKAPVTCAAEASGNG